MPLPDVPINREPNRRWINRHLNVQQDLDEMITVWKPTTGSVFEKYLAVAQALQGLIVRAIVAQRRNVDQPWETLSGVAGNRRDHDL